MLENTHLEEAPPRRDVLRGPGSAGGDVEELTRQLKRHKVHPRLLRSGNGITAGGAAIRVSVQQTLQSQLTTEHLVRRIALLAHEQVPLTLAIWELGAEDESISALEDFCAIVRAALTAEGLEPADIGISMQSHLVPLKAYLVISTALLGCGPRYIVLDSLQMRHHECDIVQAEAQDNWSFLWSVRNASPTVIPAYAAGVTTRCPLLGDETATAILPEGGQQAPVQSAWLPMRISLPDFSDGRGRIDWDSLETSLRLAVDTGDRILEHLYWHLPQQRNDAWHNRRLAISIDGVGDLVVERGADPKDLHCLKWIDEAVARIHATLWDRTRTLAQRTEPLPALLSNWPAVSWDCDIKKSNWDVRWRRAVANCAVRHRNLLVMSPYAVLPKCSAASYDFVDLLPALHHADAFSFGTPRNEGFRNCTEFATFHRRAWAVMQRRNAASLVAAGV